MDILKNISSAYFKEAKGVEFNKTIVSYVLLVTILSSCFLQGNILYVSIMFAFMLQVWLLYLKKRVNNTILKANIAKRQEYIYFLYENNSVNIELSNLYASLAHKTVEWLKGENQRQVEAQNTSHNSPSNLNKVKKLLWMIQENCFWNHKLYEKQFKLNVISLTFVIVISLLIFLLSPLYDVQFSNDQYEWLSINKFTLPQMMLLLLSSFYIIEKIETCIDFYNGSNIMDNLDNKILRMKGNKIDEFLDVLLVYYSTIISTPNISEAIYYKYKQQLNDAWAMRSKTLKKSTYKDEISNFVKIFQSFMGMYENWYIIGSCSLFLQGVNIEPNDIDILTDSEGIELIKKTCKYFVIDDIISKDNGEIRSIYGKITISNISIDVMAIPENKVGDKWIAHDEVSNHKKTVEIDSIKIPVRDLLYEKEIYERIKDEKKVAAINAFFQHTSHIGKEGENA